MAKIQNLRTKNGVFTIKVTKNKKSIKYNLLSDGKDEGNYVQAKKIDNHYILVSKTNYLQLAREMDVGVCLPSSDYHEVIFGVEDIENLPKIESRLEKEINKMSSQIVEFCIRAQ